MAPQPARERASRSQKDAGLRVADRIRVSVSADAERRAAVEEHAGYVCAETLAVELTFGAPPAGFIVRDVKLDGEVATLGLARAL